MTGITWSSWNDLGAIGVGTWGFDNCTPDCAQGTVTNYPATIRLSQPSDGRFTELTELTGGPFGSTQVFGLPGPTFRASS